MTGEPSPERGRVAFLGLGTMGSAMAANLARAGFTVTGWNRTPGRAPDLAGLGVTIAETPAAAVADARHRGHLRLGHAGRRGGPVRPRRRRQRCPPGDPHRRLLDHRAFGKLGLRQAPGRARPGHGRRSGLGWQRGRQERDADDLRRWRSRGCRARPPGPRGDGPDDHPRRTDRCRSGGQGRQPGHPGRRVPRRRRGHGPGDQGRSRRQPGGRGARRRRGPELGPRQSERPDDRQRLSARVQGRAPSQGPRHRPRPGRPARRGPPGQRPRGTAGDRADRQRPRRRRHVRPGTAIRGLSALDD